MLLGGHGELSVEIVVDVVDSIAARAIEVVNVKIVWCVNGHPMGSWTTVGVKVCYQRRWEFSQRR